MNQENLAPADQSEAAFLGEKLAYFLFLALLIASVLSDTWGWP